MAHKLLSELSQDFQELMPLLNDFDKMFYQLAFQQLHAMRNTIDGDNGFFENYFKGKTEEEIKEWIDKESKRW